MTEFINTLPADSAFVAGSLELPLYQPEIGSSIQNSSLTAIILSAISLAVILILFKKIVNIFPSLIACILRPKENINLEASVKMSIDRTIIAAAMVIPFCMVVERFNLYSPRYMAELGESLRIATTIGTFSVFFALRALAGVVCRPSKSSSHTYRAGFKASWTFFILLTLLLLSVGGIASFADLDYSMIKITMLWVSGVMYVLLLIREFQIFASSCSFITAFLYLCALEIVPSGLLVGSVYIF